MGNIEKIKKFKEMMPSKSLKINSENRKEISIESISNPITSNSKPSQTEVPIITTEKIINIISNEWQPIENLIFKLKIQESMDARYILLKPKELYRKGKVLANVKLGKKHWKLK